jgi:hypothetical protein
VHFRAAVEEGNEAERRVLATVEEASALLSLGLAQRAWRAPLSNTHPHFDSITHTKSGSAVACVGDPKQKNLEIALS